MGICYSRLLDFPSLALNSFSMSACGTDIEKASALSHAWIRKSLGSDAQMYKVQLRNELKTCCGTQPVIPAKEHHPRESGDGNPDPRLPIGPTT